MAINTATIQHRRGSLEDFNPEKLMPGEIAVITDERSVHMGFPGGGTERIILEKDFTSESIKEKLGYEPADEERVNQLLQKKADYQYVNEKVSNVKVDLTGYAKEDYVDAEIEELNKKIVRETGKLSNENAELKGDLSQLSESIHDISKQYTNIAKPISIGKSYSMPTSIRGDILSEVITLEQGHYFGYAEITVSNISGYTNEQLFLNFINTLHFVLTEKRGGESSQPMTNGKIVLYGSFDVSTVGTVKAMLYKQGGATTTWTFDYTVDKLYLFKENRENVLPLIIENDYKNSFAITKVFDGTIIEESLSEDIKARLNAPKTTIIDCWGDSLTQGSGSTSGNTYPQKLQSLVGSGFTVNNYGQGSETAEAVAFRQGGMSAIVQPFTLNSTSFIPIEYKSINGASLETVSYSGLTHGDDFVYVNGIKLMFRNRGGGVHAVAITSGADLNKSIKSEMMLRAIGRDINHIMVVCIGQNGWVDSDPEHLADVIQNMIDHNNYGKYIVCGRPTGDKTSRSNEEKVLGSRFGNHYLNLREYISAFGLSDENITPTSDDTTAMTNGAIPPSLRSDGVHLNNSGYSSMAKCIYQRGKDLGYWS